MAVHKVASNLEVLTRELAQRFASMTPIAGERDCKPKRLAFFENHVAQKTFIDPTWSKGICKTDGHEYRLDGQHSSRVLANLEAENFPELMVTVDIYEFDSLKEDAALLFEKFDHPDSVRDDLDMIHFDKAQHPDLADLDKRFLDKAAKGILFYQRELVKDGELFPKRRKGLYFDHEGNRKFVTWLAQFNATTHDWIIKKPAIVAEIYADYLYNEEMAGEFWGWVFKENHPDETHESRELTRTLKDWTRAIKKRPAIQFQKRTKQAWDRYRRLRELEKAA
jgi:hypothetical protein